MLLLDAVVGGLREVFQSHSLPLEHLAEAREFVLANKFQNRFQTRKVFSPLRDRTARVIGTQKSDEAEIILRVEGKRGEDPRELLIARESPDEFVFALYFAQVAWLADDVIELECRNGTKLQLDLALLQKV